MYFDAKSSSYSSVAFLWMVQKFVIGSALILVGFQFAIAPSNLEHDVDSV